MRGAVEGYLERCALIEVDVEALERLMEPEEVEVCLRYILEYSTRRGSNISSSLTQKEKKDPFVASRRRWLEHQGERVALQESWQNEWHDIKYQGIMTKAPPCPERTLKTPLPQQSSSSSRDEESQWISGEDSCVRGHGEERYLEDSEDLKVAVTELREQLGISEETCVSIRKIVQQAKKENGQQIFEIFRQGEEEVCIASLARWNAQLKGLVELEKYDAGSEISE